MKLTFVTGNPNKLREVQAIMGDEYVTESLAIDVPEIQSLDPREVLEAKLIAALQQHAGPLAIEDTSLIIPALGKLPGTFIKYFEQELGPDGAYRLATLAEDKSAYALTVIGYADEQGRLHYFEGRVDGQMVSPRGDKGWGFDFTFQPDGYKQTYSEMGADMKSTMSHRFKAFRALRAYLDQPD